MKKLFKDRFQFHVYFERELMEWVVNRSLDLGLSSSAYIRSLILKDKKNERTK